MRQLSPFTYQDDIIRRKRRNRRYLCIAIIFSVIIGSRFWENQTLYPVHTRSIISNVIPDQKPSSSFLNDIVDVDDNLSVMFERAGLSLSNAITISQSVPTDLLNLKPDKIKVI